MLRILALFSLVMSASASPGNSPTQSVPLPSGQGVRLEFSFPAPELIPTDGGHSVRLPGEGVMGVAGGPDLPVANRHVRVPPTKNVSVEVRTANWSSMGHWQVSPLQERLHTAADLPLPWLRDEAVYRTSQLWPTEWLRLSEPMLLRETRLVTLSVAPLRWNPLTGELLRLESLSLVLHFTGESSVNVPTRLTAEGISEDGEGVIYSWQAGEDQYLRQMLGDMLLGDDPPPAGDNGQGPLRDIVWGTPELPLNYLVFIRSTAQNLAPFQQWLEWKRQKGHHVTVKNENDLGSWTATAIRNSIISEYQNSLYPPHYVTLVGDTSGSYALPSGNSQYDHYYSTISGGDILADVVVGRISVENATQLATVFNKIVAYEQSPYLDNTSWLRRSSWLTGAGHCGESMSQLARDFGFQLIQERGYTQLDTAFCANSPSYVFNWFNQGISHYNYRGWIGMEGLDRNQVVAMQQGPRTPIAVIFTCSSGDFADDWSGQAYTEAFLRGGTTSTQGAAAAAMGFCTPQTHTAYNNLVDGGFWSALLDYRIPQVGTCMFRGKLELFNTLPPGDSNVSNFAWWANLMGDPGMEQWCGVPDVLNFETPPSSIGSGSQALDLRVLDQNGLPVAGAAVCAYRSADVTVRGLTDPTGRVVLLLPQLDAGNLSLTATRAFCKPARAAVAVDASLAMPVLQQVVVLDESGDGRWTPGERASLQLTFSNPSASAALPSLPLLAELADAQSAELLVSAAILPALPALGTAQVTGLLQMIADSAWTEGLPIGLNLHLGSGETAFLARANLALSTPALAVFSADWSAGALYPGQAANLLLRIRNGGNRTARQLRLDFAFPEASGLTASPASQVLDSLAANATLDLTLSVSAAIHLVPGYSSPLIVGWSDQSMGAFGELRATVILGDQLVGDPTGPDAWGYYAFESTDTQWTQAPVYDWREIAPNAGGSGSVVSLHDTSDEADDSRRVNLPFPFSIYGRTYTSMAVCSNGFVAFGPLAHLQTDFRNHVLPCGMGPEPMLAPMWDDFYLSGDAQVCTQYLSSEGIFIVEWYRMRTNSNNRINTFQLLLYSPALYPTPTGDGEVVFQYHTFDDNQNNSQDFPYCSIGLKNQDATIGLTLLNYHQRPSTAASFAAGKAVRISTSTGMTVDPAQLDLSAAELIFNLSETSIESATDSLTLGNSGQAPLIWQAGILPPDSWPPAGLLALGRDAGGPDSYGYIWRDSDEEYGPAAGWVDMWEQGTEVMMNGDDDIVGPFDLPFAFPFYGELQSQLWIAANGFVSFQEQDLPYWQNNLSGIPHADAPDRSLLVWWDDLFPNEDFSGYIRHWSNGQDSLVVCWQTAPHFNQSAFGGPFTFQVVLEANGRITYNYGDMSAADPDSDSGSCGVQLDESTGFAIRHMLIARDDISLQILPPFWLQLETTSGAVIAGGQQGLVLRARNDVQGLLLPPGQYTATVLLQCSDPEQPSTSIPVTLNVSDLGVPGGAESPDRFSMGTAWPNPFNPTATVDYTLPAALDVHARLYNVKGQYVGTVFQGPRNAGAHTLRVDGSRLASGVYLLKLDAGPHAAVRKLTLLK